jgi:hypothetical protein
MAAVEYGSSSQSPRPSKEIQLRFCFRFVLFESRGTGGGLDLMQKAGFVGLRCIASATTGEPAKGHVFPSPHRKSFHKVVLASPAAINRPRGMQRIIVAPSCETLVVVAECRAVAGYPASLLFRFHSRRLGVCRQRTVNSNCPRRAPPTSCVAQNSATPDPDILVTCRRYFPRAAVLVSLPTSLIFRRLSRAIHDAAVPLKPRRAIYAFKDLTA